jgi:gliding motility-associated-like protein
MICAMALGVGLALSPDYKKTPVLLQPNAETKQAVFDCPTLDDSQISLNATDCFTNNGSILGLKGVGTGTLVYTWYDSRNNIVGHSSDLAGIGQGTYKVTLTDDSKCPATTAFYSIGIKSPPYADDSNTIITQPTCNQTNGSITNITFVGSPVSYQWIDLSNNKTIATGTQLTGVGAGMYKLVITNAMGCTGQSVYTLTTNGTPTMTSYTYGNSDCSNTGSFHAIFSLKATDPAYVYAISGSNGKTFFTGQLAYSPGVDTTSILIPAPRGPGNPFHNPGLPPDTYTLTIFSGACAANILTFVIGEDKYRIDASNVIIRPNICGNYTGSIANLAFTGGPPPINPKFDLDPNHGFFWTDSTGRRIPGAFSTYLANVPAGKYTIYAVNHDDCVSDTMSFVIPDSVAASSKPIVNDVKLCLPGSAGLEVQNKDPNAFYRLYDSTKTLIDSSRAGYFVRKAAKTTVFYIQAVDGICATPLAKVTIEVVNPGVTIPNAFTPNGDGINDYWGVAGLDRYPGTEVTVFNRYGQRVYHSINYSTPFDGKYGGRNLPDGVYYYIIDTKKPDCRAGVSGSLTIVR